MVLKKFSIGVDDSDSDKFKISNGGSLRTNDRLVIDSSGNVGIGTSSPSHKLDIAGSIKIDGGWIRILGFHHLFFGHTLILKGKDIVMESLEDRE